jgi:hypothetical protein
MSDERYEHGYTIGIFLPKEAPKEVVDKFYERITQLTYGELLEGRGYWDPMVIGRAADVFQIDTEGHDCCPAHEYLSTSCFHGNHTYCQSETGLIGNKVPARCKFCSAPCLCSCHAHVKNQERDTVDG